MRKVPRHYQAKAIEQTLSCIKGFDKQTKKNPLIVMPTGSGKTIVISEIVNSLYNDGYSVLVLSHTQEIIEQDAEAIEEVVGHTVGIYSSGLGEKSIERITVAGIQSAYRSVDDFRHFDVVIVDEAHSISFQSETMYFKFLKEVGRIRIGLTATPFRTGSGPIFGRDDSTPFDYVSSNWGSKKNYLLLESQGYLCPLISKRTDLEMDTAGIRMIGGDFSEKELSDKFDREPVTNSAIKEIIAAGVNRKRWLIFAIDTKHADHIAEVLVRSGIKASVVHSKMGDYGLDRSKVLSDFHDGLIQCVVNVNVLTTGFDCPLIDLIALLSPTASPVKHVQSMGRGARISDGKENCLVLDFAGNVSRCGMIYDPVVKVKGKGASGEPVTKSCEKCNTICHAAVKFCTECGFEFKFRHNLSPTHVDRASIAEGVPTWLNVNDVKYIVRSNKGRPDVVKVQYDCYGVDINEVVCIEHRGFAKALADHWVSQRGGRPCSTVHEFMVQSRNFKKPKRIKVKKVKVYYDVVDFIL